MGVASRLGSRASVTLVSDRDDFMLKTGAAYVPFGLSPENLRLPLAGPTRRQGIQLVRAQARNVEPERRLVDLGGAQLGYDYLIIATGAAPAPSVIPGLAAHGLRLFSLQDMLRLRRAFVDVRDGALAGGHARVIFLVPPDHRCSGPLFELALMLEAWLRRHGARSRVVMGWTTFEEGFMQTLGPRVDRLARAEFARRGITALTRYRAVRVGRREVFYANGQRLPFDVLVTLPLQVAGVSFPGLPPSQQGFLPTEPGTCRVRGVPRVFAVGDAGDFPLKQADLALLQADTAAEQVAAGILGRQPAFSFEPTVVWVFESLDGAGFARVPLRRVQGEGGSVEVRPADGCRVGSSGLWRLGRRLMGSYVLWRFRQGKPVRTGLVWNGLEAGMRVFSRPL